MRYNSTIPKFIILTAQLRNLIFLSLRQKIKMQSKASFLSKQSCNQSKKPLTKGQITL